MVMEYCDKSLKTIVRDCKRDGMVLPEKTIRQVARDILHALESLHKNNIVHLDIKPENILLSLAGHFKLGDLGLCRIAQLNQGEDVSEGDSRYLAKEVLGKAEDDRLPDLTKADIFSLGMTLFEIVIMEELPNTGPHWHALRDGGVALHLKKY
jgi:serine/threonine protein kinase